MLAEMFQEPVPLATLGPPWPHFSTSIHAPSFLTQGGPEAFEQLAVLRFPLQ